MKAAIFKGKNTIEVGQRPDPRIQNPTDAIVRVVRGCVCGSDLWYYRGINKHKVGSIGHEYIGVVEAVGDAVTTLAVDDFVIAPFTYNDGTRPACLAGFQSNCEHGGAFGDGDTDGGQGEKVRAPYADATLVKVPGTEADFTDELLASFTALSDVTCTGYHAAVSAGVKQGDTVAVVGDGAVGLSAVLAAKKLGASRSIALSRNPARQAVAKQFGATDIVEERGDAGVAKIKELTGGYGAHSTVEAVGTQESMMQAIKATRPGGHVGFVGVSHGVELDGLDLFFATVSLLGGPAPVRRFLPDLIELIMTDQIDPGIVFDLTLPLEEAAEGYRAMDERRATKVLLTL